MKGLLDDPRDVPGILNQVMMLGDRAGDLDHRRFLKRVGADDVAGHLASDRDQRDGIHLGVGQARDEVQGAGAGGRHHDARLAAGAGISLGGKDTPLLVARQNGPDPVAIPRERLVQGHACAARIRKDNLDSMTRQ